MDAESHQIGAVIITPTRELAIQIDEVLGEFLAFIPQLTHTLLIGGNNPIEDVTKFDKHGANIIVATPGRLEDMFKRRQEGCDLVASVKPLEVLILDEADRLLDMGFKARWVSHITHRMTDFLILLKRVKLMKIK